MTDTEQIRQAVSKSTWFCVISTVVGLLAVITVRYYVNKTISSPITKLTDATARIGKGDLETKIQIDSHDEIAALAQSFNHMTQKLKESYARLGKTVEQRTAQLSSATLTLEEEMAQRSSAQTALQRHIKHLDCLYGLSKLIEQPKMSLEQIFQEAVNLIRNTYQYPDVTGVRITFDGIQYKTDNFQKSELSQHAQIRVRAGKAGDIEVYYLGQRPQSGETPFLEEERDLLDAVAERLGSVAERKKAEDKLQLFRNLIDRSNDCIFVIDPKWGRFLDVNDRACDSLGFTRDELLDMTVKEIDESITDDSAWQQSTQELRLRGDIVIQGRHKRRDETTFFVETSLKLVSQQKEDYIIAVARDVTERRRAEEKQAELLEEVESANRELKDFAYIISHDLKAPLRGIKTLADWLATDHADKLDTNGKEQLNLLLARVGRMHNLIDGVLRYSRVGRVKGQKVHVNLNEIIPEIIDTVAPPENIAITVENQLPVVECEKTCVIQVFQNLLSNAVKYMDKPEGRVSIRSVEENGFWKFSVSDNGPGIEEKHFERIFRIFQTLSPRDEFESTGVGLTIIKKIVELHNGKIWVRSKPGEGTTFFFTLPKTRKEVTDARLEANIVS